MIEYSNSKYIRTDTNEGIKEKKSIENDLQKKYVEVASDYIVNNYFNDISIEEVAKSVNITRAYLFRLFKRYLNTSPQQFLINLRLNKAMKLIEATSLSIGDVAQSVGYRDVLFFSKVFKKSVGVTPSEYRKSYKV